MGGHCRVRGDSRCLRRTLSNRSRSKRQDPIVVKLGFESFERATTGRGPTPLHFKTKSGLPFLPAESPAMTINGFEWRRNAVSLSEAELPWDARSLARYSRPLDYAILQPDATPSDRSAKVDVIGLQETARVEVTRPRKRGRWDGSALAPTPQPGSHSSRNVVKVESPDLTYGGSWKTHSASGGRPRAGGDCGRSPARLVDAVGIQRHHRRTRSHWGRHGVAVPRHVHP